jgi:hypothetical protein
VNEPREIEAEIEHLRTRLDRSLSELDRRRHELMDVKLQIRRHPEALAVAGGVALLLFGGMAYAIYRSRRRDEPLQQAHRFRLAVGRAADNPHRVARREPGVGEKILGAVATTIAVALTKKLIERAINSTPQRRQARG